MVESCQVRKVYKMPEIYRMAVVTALSVIIKSFTSIIRADLKFF